jgi:undecaprenyl-diphosphatase
MLLATACFCFCLPAVQAQKLNLDQQTLVELMEHRHDGATAFYRKVSNTTQFTGVLIPATVLAVGAITNDGATLKKGLYIAETLAAAELVTFGLKYSIKRQRPYIGTNVITSANGISNTPSFPSGHTSEAFSTATSLYLAYPKWYVAVPAFAWAGAVGYSRMYLGAHYPSDVLAGAVIGAGTAWLMYRANKWLFKKKPQELVRF